MASITDKITDVRNAARPNSARVSAPRSSGGATLTCDNLTGWPTASKVHFVTYKIDANSDPIAGTQLDCYGIVSGSSIGSFTVVDGTDTGHAVNDVVEMLPTAAWGQDLADAMTSQHSRTGAHSAITSTSINNAGILTQTGAASLASTLSVAGASTLTGAVGGTGYSVGTISNPYKFSVYRAAALNSGNTGNAVITHDTKLYDTGSNVDIVTNKGRFTAPINGFYHFSGRASMNATARFFVFLYKNGTTEIKRGNDGDFGATHINGSVVSADVQLVAGDYIEAWNQYGAAAQALEVGQAVNYFDGHLISAT